MGLNPLLFTEEGKRLTSGEYHPCSSRPNCEFLEFPSAVGLVTNHSMSTTTYCQPNAFKWSANHFTLALNSDSETVVPYESQLFQPMGGVAARFDSPVSVNGSTTTAFLSAAECKSPARPKRPIAKKNKESAAKRNFMRSSFASDAKRNPIPLRVSAAKKKYCHSEGIRRGCPKNLNRRNPKRFADVTCLGVLTQTRLPFKRDLTAVKNREARASAIQSQVRLPAICRRRAPPRRRAWAAGKYSAAMHPIVR